MRRKLTNTELIEAIRFLKTKARANKANIWSVAADQLSRPRSARAVLNLNHVARATSSNSLVFIPGKLLGSGLIKHRVVIGAFQYSHVARTKVEQAGGKCMSLKDFVTTYPDGSKVTIMR
ncbi:MAG TPA: 50S ribosomal protein L18e [Candidatus Bathyarchaeia archaeon]|nr:50S ribosomal protein L18e [Candidatus Bathyarchaeia archaeon]